MLHPFEWLALERFGNHGPQLRERSVPEALAMSPTIDLTDLPKATPESLALAMRLLIEDGRALILMRGASPEDRLRLEERFWERFDGTTAEGVVALLRLWCLVEVFKANRLQVLLLDRGYALLADAARAAAEQRVNVRWGFNPQRMVTALSRRRPALRIVTDASMRAASGRPAIAA